MVELLAAAVATDDVTGTPDEDKGTAAAGFPAPFVKSATVVVPLWSSLSADSDDSSSSSESDEPSSTDS